MRPAERAIRAAITPPATLKTPSRSAPFVVQEFTPDGLVLMLGAQRARTPFAWECIEGILPFLQGRGWCLRAPPIQRKPIPPLCMGTFSAASSATANWMCAVLERAGSGSGATFRRQPSRVASA